MWKKKVEILEVGKNGKDEVGIGECIFSFGKVRWFSDLRFVERVIGFFCVWCSR